LVAMMIIVNVTRRTGAFEWLAVKCAKLSRGRPAEMLVLLCLVTAVLSALLDNVTTVLLLAPVALLLCEALELDPVPFLISIVLASNIGGTATLIGHPPNIMIGSAVQFSFMDFLRVDAPLAAVVLALFLAALWWVARRRLRVTPAARERIMRFDERQSLSDSRLLRRCLVVIALTIAGFVVHGRLGLEPGTIALAGAALLLLLDPETPEEALRLVEWPTIFFFIGLFIMVSALVKTGVIAVLGHGLLGLTQGNVPAMTLGVLWFSGLACGLIDHIPYAAAMIPLLQDVAVSLHPAAATASFTEVMHAPDMLPLWWALSLGANLGANLTLVAAATNVVVSGVAERAGCPISFRRFLKYGVPITVVNLTLSSVYLWLVFLR